MPRQRWRHEVLDELRGMRAELKDESAETRKVLWELRSESAEGREILRELRGESAEAARELKAEFELNRQVILDVRRDFGNNRDAIRDMKASVDHDADRMDRCVEVLAGLKAETHALGAKVDDMAEDIRAQTAAVLTLIDEIRRNGPPAVG